MKQTSTNNHLEQFNKELQMAIDFIKTLMNKVDVRSSSHTTQSKSKTESENEKSNGKDNTSSSENKNCSLRENFVEDCSQKRSETAEKTLINFSDEFDNEPNYYYGDNLLFDSLEKIDFFKSKIKVESAIKKVDKKLETLFSLKHDTLVNHVKKLDVPTLDKKNNKTGTLKHENNWQANAVTMRISTQTSFPFEDGKTEVSSKLNESTSLQTPIFKVFSRYDAANNTDLYKKYASKDTQTQQVYLDSSSQTTKTFQQSSYCDACINTTNLNQKYSINPSSPMQSYKDFPSGDAGNNCALLRYLDTGLQTSFVVLPKHKKLSRAYHKEKHRKKTSTHLKKNEKGWLYQVINDISLEQCNNKHMPGDQNFLQWKSSPKKIKLIPQTELYKHKILYKNPVKDKNCPCFISSDKVLVLPNDVTSYDKKRNNNGKKYSKLRYKYLDTSTAHKRGNGNDIDLMRNMYYTKNYIEQPKNSSTKKKYNLKNINECVNIEGVNIQASTKVSLLDILNTL